MSDDLLNHPEVLKTIRFELLRGGYPQYRIDDGIRDVVLKVYAYVKTLPAPIATVDRMKAVVRTPAYRHGVDWVRDQIHEREVLERVADETESRNAQQPSLDQQMELTGALDVIDRGKQGRDGEILEGIKNEESDRETATRTGRKNEQVRQDTATMRKRARFNLKRAGYVTGVVATIAGIAFIVFWLRGHANDEAHHQKAPPAPSATTPPEPPPEVPVAVGPSDADRQEAADLRAHAHEARLKKQWVDCVLGYEAAGKLDPEGGDATADDDIKKCTLETMARSKP